MAMFFNSVTSRYEDDGQALPQGGTILNIPAGRVAAPSGANDVQIPLGYAQNQMRNAVSSRDLAMDMQANPQKYPFGNAFTVDTSPETLAAYKQAQAAQAPSSDKLNAMPGVAKSDLVGMGQMQPVQAKPTDISKMIAPLVAGYGTQMNAANQMMQAAAIQGVAQGEAYKQMAEINDKVNQDYAEKTEAVKQRFQEQYDKVAQVASEVQNAAQINPNRFWAEKDTGDKVAAAIAIGLGALGSALQGTGKNAALDILDKAVDKDIMAQEKAYMQKKDSLAVSQSLLGMYKNQVDDMQAAKMLAKADAISSIQYKLNETMAGVQSKEAAAKAQMIFGELQNAKGQLIYGAQQKLAQLAQQQNLYSGQGDINPMNVPKEDRDLLVNVGGRNMMARSTGAATEVREKVTALDSFQQQGRRYLELLEKKSALGAKFPTELNAELNTVASNMGVSYGKTKGMGTYDKGTAEAIAQILGDPNSFMKGNLQAKVKEALKLQEIDKQNILKANVFGYKEIK
jgi:hypothetical protein